MWWATTSRPYLRLPRAGAKSISRFCGATPTPRSSATSGFSSPTRAEDIAAETWVSVVRGLASFIGDEGAWRAWLFTTARRRMLDQARHLRRHPAEPLDEIGVAEVPTAPGAEQLALDNIATESAIALLGRLPEQQANVILLRVVAGP